MPTAATNTYGMNQLVPMYEPLEECELPVTLPASVSYAKGTVLGPVTATPGLMKAYVDAATDGSGIAKAILPMDCATDASSNITVGSLTAGAAPWGATSKTVNAYFRGTFKTSELVQSGAGAWDAAARADLYARLYFGTDADGVVHIP